MKLSPLSVPYKIVEKGVSVVIAAAVIFFSGAAALTDLVGGALIAAGLLGLLVLALIGYEVAYYRRYEYELTSNSLDIQSGVVSRRNREIPLRRIQNVDISRNVVQRVVGIAAVNFETAGGSQTEAAIRFLDIDQARRLADEISRLKRGESAEGPPEPRTDLFALTNRELGLVGALSFDLRVPGLVALVISGSVPVLSQFVPRPTGVTLGVGLVLVLVAIVLFSWAAGAVVAIVNYYGFRLTRTEDELRYERGLLQRYDGAIPFDKVQTLTIQDNPLKRYFGYATLAIETAGYAPTQAAGQGSRGSEAAVPLAKRDRVVELARAIESFGVPHFERPPKRVRRRYAARYLIVLAVVTAPLYAFDAFVFPGSFPWYATGVALPVIPVAAHYKWRHRGFWLGDEHVITRNGFWRREIKIVPYYRIQTVIDSRTIFQRRWRIASVVVDTAGSISLMGSDAAAVDIERERAATLREELAERLNDTLAAFPARRRPRALLPPGERPRTAEDDEDDEEELDDKSAFEWLGDEDEYSLI